VVIDIWEDDDYHSSVTRDAQEWFAENLVERAKIVARLMREAGEVYKCAFDERH